MCRIIFISAAFSGDLSSLFHIPTRFFPWENLISLGGNLTEILFMQRRVAEFILAHRLLISVLLLILTLALTYQLRLFRISQSQHKDLPQNDPDLVYFEQFCQRFGDAELLIIAVAADDMFTADNLQYLQQLTELIGRIPDVEEVISLTNVSDIRTDGDQIDVRLLLAEIPNDPAELAAKKAYALGNPYWVKNLVSPDGATASINAKLRYLREDETYRIAVVQKVREILRTNPHPGTVVYMTGVSPLLTDSLDYITHDLKRFMWLTPVLIILLLLLVFRTVRGALIPQIVIGASVVWIGGVFFTMGKAVGMVTTMLPTLIMVIGLSDVIHIINHYYEEAAQSDDRRQVILATMEHMISACFLTSITTAVGFASLLVADLRSIREFGIYSALGIMIAYLLGMTITPIVLSLLPLPKTKRWQGYEQSMTARALLRIERFVHRDRRCIPLLVALLTIASIIGITRLNIETQISKFIPRNAPSIDGLNFIQDHMAGFSTLELAVEGVPEVFQEPWALGELDELQTFLRSLPGVDTAHSLTEFIKETNKVMHEGNDDFYALPADRPTVAQYLLLLSMTGKADFLDSFVSFDFSGARVSARIHSMSSAEHLALLDRVETFAAQNLDPRLHLTTTGVIKLYATTVHALVNSQLRSLFFSFAIIALMIILHLRSLRIGLLAMIPNLLPILMTLGIMGWLNISLNVATVMISCIALGIAVDDTIHFLTRYRREIRLDGEVDSAIHRTMLSSGRAIVFTSLIIAAGYAVIIFSSFRPNRYFGLLTAVTMLAALIADLIVLPFLVKTFHVGWRTSK